MHACTGRRPAQKKMKVIQTAWLTGAAVQVGNLTSDAKFILLVEKDAAFMRLAGAPWPALLSLSTNVQCPRAHTLPAALDVHAGVR